MFYQNYAEHTQSNKEAQMKKLVLISVMALLLTNVEMSQAFNSRDYIPLPDNTFLMCVYFKHITANTLYSKGKEVSKDFNLTQNIGVFRPVYYKSIGKPLYGDGDFIIDPQALVYFGEATIDGAAVGNNQIGASGILDPTVTATFWFVNSPKDKLIVGFTPFITMPLGEYDKNRGFNLGSNRWTIEPEICVVKGFGDRFQAEVAIKGIFYTDNNDYLGDSKLEQDPVLGFETHMSFDITKQWYVSVDYFYANGGETEIDGVNQGNKQDNHGLGLSMFWMVGSNNQLMIEYRDDFAVKNGAGTNTFGARWAYFF